MNNLIGMFKPNKNTVGTPTQNETHNNVNSSNIEFDSAAFNNSNSNNQNNEYNMPQNNPIGFEGFGSQLDNERAQVENTSIFPSPLDFNTRTHTTNFPGGSATYYSYSNTSNNSNFPSFGSGFGNHRSFGSGFGNHRSFGSGFGNFGSFGGDPFNDPFFTQDFGSGFSGINSNFSNKGGSTYPSFNDSGNSGNRGGSTYPSFNDSGNSGNRGGSTYPSFNDNGNSGNRGGSTYPSFNDSGNSGNKGGSTYPDYNPDSNNPSKPCRPEIPSSNSKNKISGKSAMEYGKKLIGGINKGLGIDKNIFGIFSELLEKNKHQEGIKRNIQKDPRKFRESMNVIVKASKTDNFLSNQDYSKIRRKHSNGDRFVDDQFRASDASIYYTNKFKNQLLSRNRYRYGQSDRVVWKRAKDLVNNAHFVVDEKGQYLDTRRIDERNYKKYFNTTDLDQGALGNCWFISAACGIIQNYDLFKSVVPFDNTLEDDQYTGAFHFRFWLFGEWKEVVIDDFLPVDSNDRLIFSKNHELKNEFWAALFEKAYAKVCGSYEALDGGLTMDALIDMSGGIDEEFDLKKIRNTMHSSRFQHGSGKTEADFASFWDILVNARRKQSVIGANISMLSSDYSREMQTPNGLVRGHAYIITKMAEIELNGTVHKIMRIYNPWGNDVEWKGEWGDKSRIWNLIDDDVKETLELKIENDGEFWMSYKDWIMNFDMCQICNLTPNTMYEISEQTWQNTRLLSNLFSMWQCQKFHGKWVRGLSAGGRGEPNRESFWLNPQFTFVINESDISDNNSCWVIIGLMQKHTRQKRAIMRVDSAEEYIQFRLFKLKNTQEFIQNINTNQQVESRDLERVGSSGAYINKREVTSRFSLSQGAYVIIPTCYDEGAEGEFLIRIFTEKPLSSNNFIKLEPTNKVRASYLSSTPGQQQNSARDILGDMKDMRGALSGMINIASDLVKEDVYKSKPSNSNCAQM